MNKISAVEMKGNWATVEMKGIWATDALDKVAVGSEHLEIQRSGKEPVYIISATDYKLFLQLLEEAQERYDLQEAEIRMANADGDAIGFDEFFADLGV